MFSTSSKWVLLVVATAVLSACGRWGPSAMPQQPLSLRLPPPQSSTTSSVLYVANATSNEVSVYEPGGKRPLRKITDGIATPVALAEDRSGNLFVANVNGGGNGWVSVYAAGAARPTRKIPTTFTQGWSIAVAASGELFVSHPAGNAIYEYAPGAKSAKRKITDGVVHPIAMAVDAAGYLYVSNCQHCVAPSYNTLTIYAPKSEKLYRTIQMGVAGPGQVVFDRSDNAYVDNYPSVVVYAGHGTKAIRTLNGAAGVLAFDGSGNLYSGQTKYLNSGGQVLVYAPGASSPAYTIKRGIVDPQALTTDSAGDLYVANTNRNTVVVYAPGSAKPSRTITIATGLSDPQAIAFDASGNLYAANAWSSTVTVYAPGSSEVLRTITEGLASPMGLALDNDGNLYVANYDGTPDGIETDSGTVTAYAPGATQPSFTIRNGIHGWNYSLGFDPAENLYVASGCWNHNNPITVYAHGTGSLLRTISQDVSWPCAITLDTSGKLYVADYGSNSKTVAVFPPGGSVPSRTITDGIDSPDALTLDRSRNLYVTNGYGLYKGSWGSVTVYPPGHSKPSRTITRGLNHGASPSGSALSPSGELFVIDSPSKIVVYPKGGSKPDRTISRGLDGPTSLAFDRDGNLYVANCCSNTVTEYAAGSSKLIRTIPAVKGHPLALTFGPGQ